MTASLRAFLRACDLGNRPREFHFTELYSCIQFVYRGIFTSTPLIWVCGHPCVKPIVITRLPERIDWIESVFALHSALIVHVHYGIPLATFLYSPKTWEFPAGGPSQRKIPWANDHGEKIFNIGLMSVWKLLMQSIHKTIIVQKAHNPSQCRNRPSKKYRTPSHNNRCLLFSIILELSQLTQILSKTTLYCEGDRRLEGHRSIPLERFNPV